MDRAEEPGDGYPNRAMQASGRLCARVFLLLLICGPLGAYAQVRVETSTLILGFDEQGSLVQATVCYPDCRNEMHRRLELREPGGLVNFGQTGETAWVQRRGLPGAEQSGDFHLYFTHASGQSIDWQIPSAGYRLQATVTAAGPLALRGGAGFEPREAAGFGNWLEQVRYVAVTGGEVQQIGLDEEERLQVDAAWAGFRNRYWGVLASTQRPQSFDLASGVPQSGPTVLWGESMTEEDLVFYLGPIEPVELQRADKVLDGLLFAGLWSWLRWICFGFFYLLAFIHSWIPVWGLAIIALSLAAYVCMWPLSRFADRLQQQVNATESRLAPGLSRIRRESRGEEQAERILQYYKAEGVHPLYTLKSLLGVALVIPVFIGAFEMLAENIHLLHAGFLWIRDLSRPDALLQLPIELPFFGSEFNLLPFLMTSLSLWASWLHQPSGLHADARKRKVRNMWLMAVGFFLLFYTFPAGMVLYWTTTNLIAVCRGLWARRAEASAQQPG